MDGGADDDPVGVGVRVLTGDAVADGEFGDGDGAGDVGECGGAEAAGAAVAGFAVEEFDEEVAGVREGDGDAHAGAAAGPCFCEEERVDGAADVCGVEGAAAGGGDGGDACEAVGAGVTGERADAWDGDGSGGAEVGGLGERAFAAEIGAAADEDLDAVDGGASGWGQGCCANGEEEPYFEGELHGESMGTGGSCAKTIRGRASVGGVDAWRKTDCRGERESL